MNIGKRLISGLVLLAAIGPASGIMAADAIKLVEDGKPAATVVVPDAGNDKYARLASSLLVSIIKRASGAQLPVIAESKAPPAGTKIYIGLTAAAEKAGLKLQELKGLSCVQKAVAGNLFLAGVFAPSGFAVCDAATALRAGGSFHVARSLQGGAVQGLGAGGAFCWRILLHLPGQPDDAACFGRLCSLFGTLAPIDVASDLAGLAAHADCGCPCHHAAGDPPSDSPGTRDPPGAIGQTDDRGS